MVEKSVAWEGTFGHWLGMEYDEVHEGVARCKIKIEPRHCNPNGVCHGGAMFAIADDAMGAAAFSVAPAGRVPTSLQVNIHFARSARPGDLLSVSARVVSSGKRTCVLESRILDDQQRMVALLSASYMFIEPRKPE